MHTNNVIPRSLKSSISAVDLIDPKQVKCVFATDGLIKDRAKRSLILQERNRYKDLELQLLPSDDVMRFGQRFLVSIKWAMAKFDLQYFLKLDDDYFVCLKRLLSELPSRPTGNLVWGHFHCEVGITWTDELIYKYYGYMYIYVF